MKIKESLISHSQTTYNFLHDNTSCNIESLNLINEYAFLEGNIFKIESMITPKFVILDQIHDLEYVKITTDSEHITFNWNLNKDDLISNKITNEIKNVLFDPYLINSDYATILIYKMVGNKWRNIMSHVNGQHGIYMDLTRFSVVNVTYEPCCVLLHNKNIYSMYDTCCFYVTKDNSYLKNISIQIKHTIFSPAFKL